MQKYIRNSLFLTLLLSICTETVSAQVLQWSNPTKLRGAAIFTKVIGENEHGVYLLRYRNKFLTRSIIIEKYAHQLSFEDSRTIDLKKARLVKIQLTHKGLLVISSQFNRKLQSNTLIGQYYDFDLKPIGKEVEMFEEPLQDFGDRGSYRVRISDDEHHLAVLSTIKAQNGNRILHWILFDSDFVEQRKKSIEVPYKADDFVIWDFLVNNNGIVTSLSKRRIDVNKKLTRFQHNLFIWNRDSLMDLVLEDSLDRKEVFLSYNRKLDEVLVSSLYAKFLFYGLEGVSILKYNLSTGEQTEYITPFDSSLRKEINISGENMDDAIPEGFVFIQVVPRSDGGILLIAEQKDITTESDIIMVNGIPQSTSKNIYNFSDIIVLNLDSSGHISWSHVVHKNQTTMNDGGYFSSAVVFVSEHFIQLIYNDQIRNSGDVMQYTIYSNGKVMSRKLLKSELDFVVVIPPEAEQVSSNKIIIPTSKNRRFALLKLVYD